MKVSDFDYQLPDELIAQYPLECRSSSRLLKVSIDGSLNDLNVSDMLEQLNEGDLLVLNDTKVIPARLFGKKETGGKVEVLLERVLDNRTFLAQIGSSKSPKQGQQIFIEGDESAPLTVLGREGMFFKLQSSQQGSLFEWLETVGHIPLPPYIDRADQSSDHDRYQTVFAVHEGAVAAPTAGLHYDEELLAAIRNKGVNIETVTLHVGAGTYQPVRVDELKDHTMHSEYVEVGEQVCTAIKQTKVNGKRVVAVGTTVVRSLESAAQQTKQLAEQQNSPDSGDLILPFSGETSIFIYPGYDFLVVDVLQTNFHLPKSTLMMLVSAFAGYDEVMSAYQHAIQEKYRFFSYGDSMLLNRV